MGLLRFGVLDAKVYPDKVEVIIDLLWAATRHASPLVRCSSNVNMHPNEGYHAASELPMQAHVVLVCLDLRLERKP